MHNQNHILDAIGNTPLVELLNIVPKGSGRIVAKLESANPTGSMKDRLARTLIKRAAAKGLLLPSGTVVEYTAAPPAFPLPSSPVRLATRRISPFPTLSAMRNAGPCAPSVLRSLIF